VYASSLLVLRGNILYMKFPDMQKGFTIILYIGYISFVTMTCLLSFWDTICILSQFARDYFKVV
jgi:hypothetical protein